MTRTHTKITQINKNVNKNEKNNLAIKTGLYSRNVFIRLDDSYAKLNKSETSHYALSVNDDRTDDRSVISRVFQHHISDVSSGIIPAGDEDEAEGPVEEVDGQVQSRGRSGLWWSR